MKRILWKKIGIRSYIVFIAIFIFLIAAGVALYVNKNDASELYSDTDSSINNNGLDENEVISTEINSLDGDANDGGFYTRPYIPETIGQAQEIDLHAEGVKVITDFENLANYPNESDQATEQIPTQLATIPPEYIWWYGCAPTAAGMVLGWWDSQSGFGDLFEGNASTWWGASDGTTGTKHMVASKEHIDAGKALGFTYGSYQNHTANSIADFIQTENGSTAVGSTATGIRNFALWDDPSTASTSESYASRSYNVYINSPYDSSNQWFSFNDYKEQIDAGRPVLLSVGNGSWGHFVIGFGYDTTDGKQNYLLWTTWSGWGIRSWEWPGPETNSGDRWVVASAILFNVIPRENSTNQAPFLFEIPDRTIHLGETVSFSHKGWDPDGTATLSVLNSPTGATYTNTSGTSGKTFSWTPTQDQVGTHTIRFEASDGELVDYQDVVITVLSNSSNQSPVLAPIGNKTVNENSTLTFTITASDAEGDTLSYSASNLPSGATFNTATKTFSWSPSYTQAGTYSGLRFTVSDGTSTDYEDITITVNNINRAPVLASIGAKSVNENSNLSFVISASDADNDSLSYSASNLPSGATFNTSTKVFSWTPLYTQAGTYNGVRFSVSDGTSTDYEDITITVNNIPVAPVLAGIGNKTGDENKVLSFAVSASDADSPSLSYSASNLPSGATFNTSTKVFSWTPLYTQAGTYNGVRFSVSDGTLTDYEDITITIRNSNRSPVFDAITDKSVKENETLAFTVSATDPDGENLSYSVVHAPSGATFNASTRTFSWKPDYTQSGAYQITFVVSDPYIDVPKTITITVVDVPQDTSTNDTGSVSSKTYEPTITLSGAKRSDVRAYYGDTLIADFGTTSWQITISLNTSQTSYDIVYRNSSGGEVARKVITIHNHRLADVNGDGAIDLLDLSLIANYWDQDNPSEPLADLNSDAKVDLMDLSIFANNWGG